MAANITNGTAFGNPGGVLANPNDNNCTQLLGWIFNAALANTSTTIGNCPLIPKAAADLTCLAAGRADIYGRGIRTGLYLQWSSSVLSFLFHPSAFPSLLVTNAVFAIAVGIAYLVVRSEVYKHEVMVIAVVLLMTLMLIPLEALEVWLFWDSPKEHEELDGGGDEPEEDHLKKGLTEEEKQQEKDEKAAQEAEKNADPDAPPPKPEKENTDAEDDAELMLMVVGWIQEYLLEWLPLHWLKRHINTVGSVCWIVATIFLLVVDGFVLFRGPAVASKVCPCCRPKFLGTYYMEMPYLGAIYFAYAILAFMAVVAIAGFAWTRYRHMTPAPQSFLDQHWRRRIPVAIFYGLSMAATVAFVETTVVQNQIRKVSSVKEAGQIIPLVVGLASFGFALYETFKTAVAAVEEEKDMEREEREEREEKRSGGVMKMTGAQTSGRGDTTAQETGETGVRQRAGAARPADEGPGPRPV